MTAIINSYNKDIIYKRYKKDYLVRFYKGKVHSFKDEPAIINTKYTEIKYWYKNGLNHRDNNLPAIEHYDGERIYFIDGIQQFSDQTQPFGYGI